MQKLIDLFNRIGINNDKVMHLVCGLLVTICVGLVTNAEAGLVCGVMAGILKELYDFYDYGLFDCKDMFATWLGAGLGYVAYFMSLKSALLHIF